MADYRFCPKCDYSTVNQEYKFCENSGDALIDSCPNCHVHFATPPLKFCGNCGKAIRVSQENY